MAVIFENALGKWFWVKRAGRRASGFTLLEVLIVVFILAATALAAVSVVDLTDGQFRQQDTRARLKRIEQGILGDSSLSVNGQPIVSGFVADVGRLPRSLEELTRGEGSHAGAQPLVRQSDGPQPPTFDPTPEATGFDSRPGETHFNIGEGPHGDAVYLDISDANDASKPNTTDPALALRHGYRGSYLAGASQQVGGDAVAFTDGWGNIWDWQPAVVAPSPIPQTLRVAGLGADGSAGNGSNENEHDTAMTIAAGDWETGQIPVRVINRTGATIDDLRVCLLVYTDRGDVSSANYTTGTGGSARKHGFWRRIDAPGTKQSIDDGASRLFSFSGSSQDIPLGDHYVLVYQDPDGFPGGQAGDTGDDLPLLIGPPASQRYAFLHARFLPRIDTHLTIELTD